MSCITFLKSIFHSVHLKVPLRGALNLSTPFGALVPIGAVESCNFALFCFRGFALFASFRFAFVSLPASVRWFVFVCLSV